MTARTPQTIAAHLRHISAPAVAAAVTSLEAAGATPISGLARRVIGCGVLLDAIDLPAITASLAEQCHQAEQGRPRSGGGRGSGGITNTTADNGIERHRITEFAREVLEAVNRLHPDPSAQHTRTPTATENVLARCADAYGTLNPDRALDEIRDAVDGLCIATKDVLDKTRAATSARAWYHRPPGRDVTPDIDPPDPLLEAARCTSWPLGVGKDGQPNRCGNYRGAHARTNPHTGSEQNSDLCDDCYRLVCPKCWSRVRQTPNSKECGACEIRDRRARAA